MNKETNEPFSIFLRAASKGDIKRLESWRLAGANLNQPDPCGRTALHAAVEAGYRIVVDWLLAAGVDTCVTNRLGQVPFEIAQLLNLTEIVSSFLSANSAWCELSEAVSNLCT